MATTQSTSATTTQPEPLAAPVLTPEATTATQVTAVTAEPSEAPLPAATRPRLISADRYDLTEA